MPSSLAPTTPRSLSTRLGLTVLVSVPAALLVALLVVAVEGAWSPLHRLDESVAANLHAQALDHPQWVHVLVAVTDAGSPTVMRGLVGVLALVLWFRGARRLALWAAATMIGGALIDAVLKSAVGRVRPSFAISVAQAPGPSFPSGHAFTATIGAGVLVLWVLPLLSRRGRVVAWVLGALVPFAVGYSRVALGVHWASDVVGGWLLGVGLLAATTAAFETWRHTQGRPSVHAATEGVAPEESQAAAPATHAAASSQDGPTNG